VRYDRNGHVRPDKSAPDSDSFYPEGLETAIRYAARVTGKPVYISENGFNTADDTRRVEFIRRAVAGVRRALDDQVDVRSYVHWSLMDNFEWTAGYQPKYGLLSVDRTTLQRTIKPSAVYLGSLARALAV
jgi:beta-glucosidase